MFDKHPQLHDLIDSQAWNVFSQGMTAAALKCSSGFNMHVMKYCSINENVNDSSFPECSETEDWDYLVNCRCAEGK